MKTDFLKSVEALGLAVYPNSVDEAEKTVCAVARNDKAKYLAVSGEKSSLFSGEEKGSIKLCPLTAENGSALMSLFPYTKPQSHRSHPFTIGL